MHLLIAGIPATGKTTFSLWLVEHHDYLRLPYGEEPGDTFYGDIARVRADNTNVVIDWGFPVGALPIVRILIEDGVGPWWFDGDREAALQCFLARPHHPGARVDWDRQLANIEARWAEIAYLFGDRNLNVVSEGPTQLGCADKWAVITARPIAVGGRQLRTGPASLMTKPDP